MFLSDDSRRSDGFEETLGLARVLPWSLLLCRFLLSRCFRNSSPFVIVSYDSQEGLVVG